MGWNSWDCYGDSVNEKQLRQNAEYMAENLKEYGWEYIVCDIQWYEPGADGYNYHSGAALCMDEYSRLIPAEGRFPSSAGGKGFKPIADYIHSLGLKFGIHIMRGIPRQAVDGNCRILCDGVAASDIADKSSYCRWNTDMYSVDMSKKGAQEYYDSLFELYASWGVDYVKCDDIANTELFPDNPYSARAEIEALRRAIDKCGREIVLSLSPGPAPVSEHKHLAENANLWRITGDFWDDWSKVYDMFGRCLQWQDYVSSGAWPDCDMLPVGHIRLCENGGRMTRFTKAEQRTVMTLWSIFRSPLMIGCELTDCDAFTLSLFTNRELIKMLKTSCGGRQTLRNEENGKGETVWEAKGENCRYIALFNTDDKIRKIRYNSENEIISDIWENKTVDFTGEAEVEPHGVRLFKMEKK